MKEPFISDEAKKMAKNAFKVVHTGAKDVTGEWIDFKNDAINNAVKYAGRGAMVFSYLIFWNAFSLKSVVLGLVALLFMVVGALIAKYN